MGVHVVLTVEQSLGDNCHSSFDMGNGKAAVYDVDLDKMELSEDYRVLMGVTMEKYCPKCHKIYENMKDKFCSNCGTKLKSREKRKPIPPELRHKVFVRDGYRCRECGKSNKETSLEIDHIFPLSKGGPTTEENLQVLCTECNRAKKDDEWKDEEIDVCRNALSNLENQLHEHDETLKVATTQEEIYDLKAKIKRIKTIEIPEEEKKLKNLIQEEKRINDERKACQKENNRRKNLFNKLYVDLEGELLSEVCSHFSLNESSDEDNIRLLIDKYEEQVIYSTISSIEKELEEESIRKELYDKLDNTLSPDEINLFVKKFSFQGSKHELLNYLIYNYSEDEIDSLKIKLVEKEQKRIEEELRIQEEEKKREKERLTNEAKEKLRNKLLKKLTPEELHLLSDEFSSPFSLPLNDLEIVNYLIDNYNENEIESLILELDEQERKRLELERRKKLSNKILNKFDDFDFKLISKNFSLNYDDNNKIVEYLINNYKEHEIFNLILKLRNQAKHDLINELKLSLDFRQLMFLHRHLSLKECTKSCLLDTLERKSLNQIKEIITLMNEDTENRNKVKTNTEKTVISKPQHLPDYGYYCKQCGMFIVETNVKYCPSCGSTYFIKLKPNQRFREY